MARGREANGPASIPARGWLDIASRMKTRLDEDHINLVAAGVAFYFLLALFPGITAAVAIAGLVLDPTQVDSALNELTRIVPPDAAEIILSQARSVAAASDASLGLATLASLLLSFYSASKGVQSLMEGLNVAYDEKEKRGFIARQLVRVGLAAALCLAMLAALASTIALSALMAAVALPEPLATILGVGRWIVLGLIAVAGLSLVYRYAPSRRNAQWRWLTPGAAAATMLWLLASMGFAYYVSNFGSYNETFGSIAGVIVLLIWLWASAFIILLGAELNAEMEAQTTRDSTVGAERPLGRRGAVKADEIGAPREAPA